MNLKIEHTIAFLAGINAIFVDLKITNEKEKKRLRTLAAKKMGETLGVLELNKINKEVEEQMQVENKKS